MIKAFTNYKILFFSFFIIIDIYYSEIYSKRDIILLKGRKYMNRCLKQKLNRKIKKFVNPKVTIIIPIYTIFTKLSIIQIGILIFE